MVLDSLKDKLPFGDNGRDSDNTRFSQSQFSPSGFERNPPREKSIDEKLREEKQELEQMKKREELKQIRKMKQQMKERRGEKSLISEAADTIAPPTHEGTSQDIIEVFAGIGVALPPDVEDEEEIFEYEPGEPPVRDVNMPDMGDLRIPVKDGEVEEVLNFD